MNNFNRNGAADIPDFQIRQFQQLIVKLYQCCQERMLFQSEKFSLPDAELRCLLLFGEERYLTAKGIALKMNVVKSRVTRIIEGLVKKDLITRTPDPEDSRVILLALTADGRERIKKIHQFLHDVHLHVLSRMAQDQRNTLLTHLELLKASLESAKELMI